MFSGNGLLPVLLIALFPGPQERPAESWTLSGIVVNSVTGEPLNKVDLRVEPIDGQGTTVAVTTSDAEGRFAMVDLSPVSTN